MANITLPSNPVNGQTVVIKNRLFQYDSTAGRWKSRVFQVLGDTSVTVANQPPTITASLSEIALDTSGANVSFTYTVSDVDSSVLKVSHSVSGIANSDLATVTHHRANNTVTITAGTEIFEGGQITLTVTDGRNNATDTVDVSASYVPDIGESYEGGFYAGRINDDNNNKYDLIISPKSQGLATGLSLLTGGGSAPFSKPVGFLQYGGEMTDLFYQTGISPAANFVKGLTIGGYTDWYIPSRYEIEIIYYNLKPTSQPNTTDYGVNPHAVPPRLNEYTSSDPSITSATAFQDNGPESLKTPEIDGNIPEYWTSTQQSGSSAYALRSYNTFAPDLLPPQSGVLKDSNGTGNELLVRAIRRVPV
jgi:hypothetical protein